MKQYPIFNKKITGNKQIHEYIQVIFLSHYGIVMCILSQILVNIGSGNGLFIALQHQAIAWTNAGSFSIRPLEINQ